MIKVYSSSIFPHIFLSNRRTRRSLTEYHWLQFQLVRDSVAAWTEPKEHLPFHVVMRKLMMQTFFSDASWLAQLGLRTWTLFEHFTLFEAFGTTTQIANVKMYFTTFSRIQVSTWQECRSDVLPSALSCDRNHPSIKQLWFERSASPTFHRDENASTTFNATCSTAFYWV